MSKYHVVTRTLHLMHFIYDMLHLLSEPKEAQQVHDRMDSKIKWPKGGGKKSCICVSKFHIISFLQVICVTDFAFWLHNNSHLTAHICSFVLRFWWICPSLQEEQRCGLSCIKCVQPRSWHLVWHANIFVVVSPMKKQHLLIHPVTFIQRSQRLGQISRCRN